MGKIRKNIAKIISKYLGRSVFVYLTNILTIYRKKKENHIIRKYLRTSDILVEQISKKERIKAIFFVISLSMWKYHDLFSLLKADERFNPVIVPFVVPASSLTLAKEMRDQIVEYCVKNSFNYSEYFDYEKGRYVNCQNLTSADVVVYSQPYNRSYPELRIENYLKRSLFIYTPYGLQVDDSPQFYDNLLQNIAQRIFLSCNLELKCQQHASRNQGINARVVGLNIYEDIKKAKNSPWKNDQRKKIIWAPHHSIRKIDPLNNSNFLDICFDMLTLAKEMSKQFQFAFKPHPSLKGKLFEIWGKEKTESYYGEWKNLENTFISDGLYADLFKFSDALIHDCSSFTCEYLVTDKPVLYLSKGNHISGLNDFGVACYNQHYKGSSIKDIRLFLENQVLAGKDYLKENRDNFVDKELKPFNNNGVGMNMYNLINELFSTQKKLR